MAKLRDKVKMPAPKMQEEEELDVMELGDEEQEMMPDEEAPLSPLSDVSDEELMAEVEARGLGIEGMEKKDAEVEVPEDEDELDLDF